MMANSSSTNFSSDPAKLSTTYVFVLTTIYLQCYIVRNLASNFMTLHVDRHRNIEGVFDPAITIKLYPGGVSPYRYLFTSDIGK